MTVSTHVYDALYDMVLDPTLLDLVLAMPDLSWREVGSTIAMLLAWDILTKPLAAFFWRHSRRWLSWGLFKLATALDPAIVGSGGQMPIGSASAAIAA